MNFNSLPKEKSVIITAGLKKLNTFLNLEYNVLTQKLLDEIQDNLLPSNIFVPTFNYDFLKLGFYDHLNSKSQIGRFSEEFRKKFPQNRSLDPVFNYTSIKHDAIKKDSDWCRNAFKKNSFFSDYEKKNFLVINIDIPTFTSTFIHYLENKFEVTYRYHKTFDGKITAHDKSFNFRYKYYVRDLKITSSYNGLKISNFLKEKSILNTFSFHNVKVDWYYSQDLIFELSKSLKKNKNFFID